MFKANKETHLRYFNYFATFKTSENTMNTAYKWKWILSHKVTPIKRFWFRSDGLMIGHNNHTGLEM